MYVTKLDKMPNDSGDRPVLEIEVTEEMLRAGREAFSWWVSSREDEDVVQTTPSSSSVDLLSSAIIKSMISSSPLSTRKVLISSLMLAN